MCLTSVQTRQDTKLQNALQTRSAPLGRIDLAARRALLIPVTIALAVMVTLVLTAPWPLDRRLVLVACDLMGAGFIGAEFLIQWERYPAYVYLPVPALGLVDVGLGMWASGGWSSPFTGFLMLPTAYAVIATRTRPALPIAVMAGLVAASPALYTPHTSFLIVALGAVPAYVTLIIMIGAIMAHLRQSDRTTQLEVRSRLDIEARARDLLTLQRVSAIVASHLTLDDAIEAIIQEIPAAFGHSLVSLYLYDGAVLRMQAQTGYETYFESLEVGEGVIGTVFVLGETIFVRDVRNDVHYLPATTNVASEIAVPLVDEGKVVGVLNIESREQLDDRDRDLIELFGAQVSVVLRNARLAGRLRTQAEHDALTGLLNRGTLDEKLEQALADRRGGCAVLVIDMNDFKQINDTHGHLIGDAILQHAAAILRDSCREVDLCGRYGGDEFVVVLPNARRAQATAVANRIADGVRRSPFTMEDGDPIHLSLSVGIAVAPEDGATREDVLKAADAAMYAAKRAE